MSFFNRNSRKAAAEQSLCRSCYLLASEDEFELSPAPARRGQGKNKKSQTPQFVDEEHCSSCNADEDADDDYLASETSARRAWWYAGSGPCVSVGVDQSV